MPVVSYRWQKRRFQPQPFQGGYIRPERTPSALWMQPIAIAPTAADAARYCGQLATDP
ncbi:MAG TPA: hypothetical protein VKV05_01225 [Terriglobales bacterium]|nr:hypothetical protein [Terriglobales bacterium]